MLGIPNIYSSTLTVSGDPCHIAIENQLGAWGWPMYPAKKPNSSSSPDNMGVALGLRHNAPFVRASLQVESAIVPT